MNPQNEPRSPACATNAPEEVSEPLFTVNGFETAEGKFRVHLATPPERISMTTCKLFELAVDCTTYIEKNCGPKSIEFIEGCVRDLGLYDEPEEPFKLVVHDAPGEDRRIVVEFDTRARMELYPAIFSTVEHYTGFPPECSVEGFEFIQPRGVTLDMIAETILDEMERIRTITGVYE